MPKDKALMELMEYPKLWLPETADKFVPATPKGNSPSKTKQRK
jgi:hypothetical protein